MILPLITEEDIEMRMGTFYGKQNHNYEKQKVRDIKVMERLVKNKYQKVVI